MRATLLVIAALFLAAPAAWTQSPADEPLPENVVARIGSEDVLKQDYLEYLYRRFGKRGVEDMVAEILIDREAKRYGVEVSVEAIAKAADEREESQRRGMDEAAFLANLQRNGQDYAAFRSGLEKDIRSELLTREIVMKTRVATDEKIQSFFERKYGIGGVRMRVRHVLVMPNILRAELVRGGTQPDQIDMAELREKAQQQAQQAADRLAAGEDFATVAAELSHDRVTKDRGGEIQNYNGRLYGPQFRNALEQLGAGETSGVVESGAGFHVVELVERTDTSIASVREELVTEIMAAEPTFQEMSAVRSSLLQSVKLRLF